MSLITGLGYVGLGVKNVDAWESFGTQILGLENGGRTDDGRQLLRMDEYEYRFALHHDDADDIAYAGWEVADASGLREIAERLRTIGVEVSAGTTEDTKIRRVTELIKFTDPNGVACEAFYGPWIQFEKPFHSPRPISGFVSGPQGLGHIVMTASDIEKSLRFYLDGLGFRISDTIDMKLGGGVEGTMTFMHCNARHHSLALVPFPAPKRLFHVMIQVRSIDDVGSTMYLVQDRNIEIASTLGRHTNDHMLSFYMRSPSGFEIEYGWAGVRLMTRAGTCRNIMRPLSGAIGVSVGSARPIPKRYRRTTALDGGMAPALFPRHSKAQSNLDGGRLPVQSARVRCTMLRQRDTR